MYNKYLNILSCQLCTATHTELKDQHLILQGFPINRHISDAI